MKCLEKFVSVPDAWRRDYPHFIGPPTLLRILYIVAVFLTVLVFAASIVYYTSYDIEVITKITQTVGDDSEWTCASIGVYNGDYELLPPSEEDEHPISSNLDDSTATGYVNYFDESEHEYARVREFESYTFHFARPYSSEDLRDEDFYKYTIRNGNAGAMDSCVNGFDNNICSLQEKIDDITVYQFEIRMALFDEYSMDQLLLCNVENGECNNRLFDTRGAMGSVDINFGNSANKWWVVTVNEDNNLCNVIDDAIDTGYTWADVDIQFYTPTRYDVKREFSEVVCTRYADYCMVNTKNQFEGSDTSMTYVTETSSGYDTYPDERMLLLGKELGSSCSDRWMSVCQNNFDFEGLCDTMFVSPYECTKEKKKSLWTVLSLSFASAQLVFTIILTTIGFVLNLVYKSDFSDKSDGNADRLEETIQSDAVPKQGFETNIV